MNVLCMVGHQKILGYFLAHHDFTSESRAGGMCRNGEMQEQVPVMGVGRSVPQRPQITAELRVRSGNSSISCRPKLDFSLQLLGHAS